MENLEKYFLTVLDKLHDSTYFTHNKEIIKSKTSSEEFRPIVEKYLRDGKKYSVLKFIDRMEMQFDNELYLNYYKYEENKNANLYMLFFNLHIKNLITRPSIKKIKSKYSLEIQTDLDEVEKKCLYKKIETDRHFMKKERNRVVHDNNIVSVTRSELLLVNGISIASKRVYVIDVTDLFNFNLTKRSEKDMQCKINYVHNKFFEFLGLEKNKIACLEPKINVKMIDQYTCDIKDKRCAKTAVGEEVNDEVNEVMKSKCIDDYRYASQRYYNREEIHNLHEGQSSPYINLRKIVDIFINRQHSIYIISRIKLDHLLATCAVFGLNQMNPEYIISSRHNDVNFIVNLIKSKEKANSVVFCGKAYSVGKENYVVNDVMELFEMAIRLRNYGEYNI